MNADNIENLIKLFNKGDEKAFTKIYNKLYANACNFAKRYVNAEEAKDLTTESLLKIWNKDKNFQSINGLKTYLFVIIKHKCLNYIKKYNSKKIIELPPNQELDLFDDSYCEYKFNAQEENVILKRLHNSIENLPSKCKQALILNYFHSFKEKEVAKILSISPSTVKLHKKRALNHLRNQNKKTQSNV